MLPAASCLASGGLRLGVTNSEKQSLSPSPRNICQPGGLGSSGEVFMEVRSPGVLVAILQSVVWLRTLVSEESFTDPASCFMEPGSINS